jgi:hypothetical protein
MAVPWVALFYRGVLFFFPSRAPLTGQQMVHFGERKCVVAPHAVSASRFLTLIHTNVVRWAVDLHGVAEFGAGCTVAAEA